MIPFRIALDIRLEQKSACLDEHKKYDCRVNTMFDTAGIMIWPWNLKSYWTSMKPLKKFVTAWDVLRNDYKIRALITI